MYVQITQKNQDVLGPRAYTFSGLHIKKHIDAQVEKGIPWLTVDRIKINMNCKNW